MTYDDIMQVLCNGKSVFWVNKGYKVYAENGKLYSVFVRNGSVAMLRSAELKDCFLER